MFETLQTEDAGDRPTGHYDEFGFMVDGGMVDLLFLHHYRILLNLSNTIIAKDSG